MNPHDINNIKRKTKQPEIGRGLNEHVAAIVDLKKRLATSRARTRQVIALAKRLRGDHAWLKKQFVEVCATLQEVFAAKDMQQFVVLSDTVDANVPRLADAYRKVTAERDALQAENRLLSSAMKTIHARVTDDHERAALQEEVDALRSALTWAIVAHYETDTNGDLWRCPHCLEITRDCNSEINHTKYCPVQRKWKPLLGIGPNEDPAKITTAPECAEPDTADTTMRDGLEKFAGGE